MRLWEALGTDSWGDDMVEQPGTDYSAHAWMEATDSEYGRMQDDALSDARDEIPDDALWDARDEIPDEAWGDLLAGGALADGDLDLNTELP